MDENKQQHQRNFYLYLSPFEGHQLAEEHGNFPVPPDDIHELEVRDVLKFWMTVQALDAGEIIADSAWWATQMHDPDSRLGATEGVASLDKFTSFAMTVIHQLVDAGVMQFTNTPDLPDFALSSSMDFGDNDLDFLSHIQQLLEEDEDDE